MGVSGAVGPVLCRVLHPEFGEEPFHALGCITDVVRCVGCRLLRCLLPRGEEAGAIRVLIAIAPKMYGQVLAHSIAENRPDVEVLRLEPAGLDGWLEGFDPQLIFCNEATDRIRAHAASWVVLAYPAGGTMDATACLRGHRSALADVALADMLALVDAA